VNSLKGCGKVKVFHSGKNPKTLNAYNIGNFQNNKQIFTFSSATATQKDIKKVTSK
jgi:hypothetical protein